jgi:hypothetical protein
MLEACSDAVGALAVFGGLSLYVLFALGVSQLFLAVRNKEFRELNENEALLCVLGSVFFPAAIVAGVVGLLGWWVWKLLILPYNAATKRDLKEVERRLENKIIFNTPNSKEGKGNITKDAKKIIAGDLVTGVKGNPDNYTHLNEGCVCRVKSIDEKGSMQLVLIDHKNFGEHRNFIGNTFTAPERNFVKYKKK